jgi:hypothetical protein
MAWLHHYKGSSAKPRLTFLIEPAGIPGVFSTICLLKAYTRSSADKLSLYDIKYPYFISRSITTKIKLKTTFIISSTEDGNLIIKSNATHF